METVDQIAARLGAALDELGIPYFVGGSVASSLQGEPRATNDIDVVVDLKPGQAASLAARLGDSFDVDIESLEDAVRRRASWNVFFLPTLTKIDVFILRPSAFDRSEFERRRRIEIEAGVSFYVKSPEDTVLRKLRWFEQGGRASTNQWRDVVEVLRVSGPSLDVAYLDTWAESLGVRALLDSARAEADRSG